MGPAEAVKVLREVLAVDAPPQRAKSELVRISISKNWHVDPERGIGGRRTLGDGQFLKKVAEEVQYWESLGRVLPFVLNTSSSYLIQGAGFIEPNDSDDQKEAKRALCRVGEYCAAFKNLDPTQFESLCAGVLEELGVSGAKLTPKTRDEGIDFYGRLSLEKLLRGKRAFPGFERQLSVWMVGQAKPFMMIPFRRSTLENWSSGDPCTHAHVQHQGRNPVCRFEAAACDPIFYLFMTTGEFSNDVLTSAAKIRDHRHGRRDDRRFSVRARYWVE